MILGLSHVFGESADLDAAAAFWGRRGWQVELATTIPVPPAKRSILWDADSTEVALRYLVRSAAPRLPGMEFLRHSPRSRSMPPCPTLALALPGAVTSRTADAEGNEFMEAPVSGAVVTLRTPDVEGARDRLRTLGFTSNRTDPDRLSFASRLLNQRSATIDLRLDSSTPVQPRVDTGGWNGLSLLVRDLDAIAARIPLTAQQEFSVREGDYRRLAFFSGEGLLLEFLQVGFRGAHIPATHD